MEVVRIEVGGQGWVVLGGGTDSPGGGGWGGGRGRGSKSKERIDGRAQRKLMERLASPKVRDSSL
jgi:hypothetical protein